MSWCTVCPDGDAVASVVSHYCILGYKSCVDFRVGCWTWMVLCLFIHICKRHNLTSSVHSHKYSSAQIMRRFFRDADESGEQTASHPCKQSECKSAFYSGITLRQIERKTRVYCSHTFFIPSSQTLPASFSLTNQPTQSK